MQYARRREGNDQPLYEREFVRDCGQVAERRQLCQGLGLVTRETLIYSRVCARDRFWSSGKARCRFGGHSYRASGATQQSEKMRTPTQALE